MRTFRLVLVLTLASSARAYNCTGKPTTYGDILVDWSSIDISSRPGIAARSLEGDSPPNVAPPDDIYVSLQINRLAAVSTQAQTFTVEVWLRTIWLDERLAFDDECLPLSDFGGSMGLTAKYLDRIWTPDLFSPSEAQAPKVLGSAVWVWPHGKVWWLRKMLWTLNCDMDFTHMPRDAHNCTFVVAGFAHESTEISLQFPDGTQPEPVVLSGPIKPVCMSGAGGSVEFSITSIEATRIVDASQSTKPNSQLVYHIQLTRGNTYYMRYVVMPTVLVVVVTWLSFWISRAAVPARIAMVIIAFLTLSGMINSALSTLPKLNGAVWLLSLQQVSLFFVFTAILEFAGANYLGRLQARVVKATTAAEKRRADDRGRGGAAPPPDVQTTPVDSAAGGGAAIAAIEVCIKDDPARAAAQTSSLPPPSTFKRQHTRAHMLRVPPSLLEEVRASVGPAERALLPKASSGNDVGAEMRLTDEHLDLCCRFGFLPAYLIALAALFAALPAMAETTDFLSEACVD